MSDLGKLLSVLDQLSTNGHEIQITSNGKTPNRWLLTLDGITRWRGTDLEECLGLAYEDLISGPMREEMDEIP